MSDVLTRSETVSFLKETQKNSQLQLLEGGKEKDELIKAAAKRGILNVDKSRDLGVIKTIYAFTDTPNDNGDILPEKEFKKKFPGIVGKLMNVGHSRQFIVGYYIDYKYIVKENKAIAYAIFFKSAFPKLWEKAKKFLKEGKLSSSFEIWSPKEDIEHNEDGTHKLNKMEMAGGAMIFEDEDNQPAFQDAKFLNIAKKCIDNKTLYMAKKYKKEDIITAGDNVSLNEKITCKSCDKELDRSKLTTVKEFYKCPSCKCLINRRGDIKYPEQDINMSIRCSRCNSPSWLIKSKGHDKIKIECLRCEQNFIITKAKTKKQQTDLKLVALRNIKCPQCRHSITIGGFSDSNAKKEVVCDNCGLEFMKDPIKTQSTIHIKKMVEIDKEAKDKLTKSSEEGGKKMKIPKKVEDRVKQKEAEKQKDESDALEELKAAAEKSKDEAKVEEPKDEAKDAKSEDKSKKEVSSSEEIEEVSENKTSKSSNPYPKTAGLRKAIKKIKDLEAEIEKSSKLKLLIRKSAKRTVLARKKMKKLEEAKERNASGVRKTVKRLINALNESNELEEELEKAKKAYKENAKKIVARRQELGEFAEELSDEDVLDDEKYDIAKIRKENKLMKSQLKRENSGEEVAIEDAQVDDEEYNKIRDSVNKETERWIEK